MSRKDFAHLLVGVLICTSSCRLRGQCNSHARLDDMERAGFVAAAQEPRSDISVELLSNKGCSPKMLDGLRRLGAKEQFTDGRVGYAWVMLPKDKVLDVLDLPGVSEAYASVNDNEYELWDPPQSPGKLGPVPSFTIPIGSVATDLPAGAPYFPAEEAGLTRLWRDHPAADGRGVRIALLDDGGLDLLHPALRKTLDATGHDLPKVADIHSVAQAKDAAGWVQFGAPIKTSNRNFQAADRTWVAPYDGTFRFGIFSTGIYFGAWIPGYSRGTPPVHVDFSVGVLCDEDSNRIWVDTNGDGSFLDQKPLGDYGHTQDLDYFGEKTAEGDNRIPFGVKIDKSHNRAYLSLMGREHATVVAGTLAANRLTGGLFDGAAPNAQLIDVRASSLNGKLAAAVASLSREDVDVLNESGVFFKYAPASGLEEGFARHVLDRATSLYDKALSCYCSSINALFVADYQSGEMLRRNRQIKAPDLEVVDNVSDPEADGLLNAIVAPSTMLDTQSRYTPIFTKDKDGRFIETSGLGNPPGPSAPDGYWIGNNPSPTVPFGTGVLADLISEARSRHVRYTSDRLVQAVLISGRIVQRFSMEQQGHGLINAAGAWDQLERMSKADDPANTELTSFVVEEGVSAEHHRIEGVWSDFPTQGTHVGQLWITRQGGYSGTRSYKLSLRGNDGTFKLLTHGINLMKDKPTLVRFSFKTSPGRHLVFLQLKDVSTGVVMKEIPMFVRASVGEAIAPGVDQYQATISPLSGDYESVYLGPEIQAARFVMRIPNAGRARYSNRFIPGFRYDAEGSEFGARLVETTKPIGLDLDPAHHVGPMEEFESIIPNSGVVSWERPHVYSIYWSNGAGVEYATPYDDEVPDVPITGTLLISKYAVTLKEEGINLIATNDLADLAGRVELYDGDLEASQLDGAGNHAVASFEHDLPANVTQWRIRISSTSVGNQAADAFVFQCSGERNCEFVAQTSIAKSGATLTVDDPREGPWRVIVRTRDEVTQPISYHVEQALLHQDTAESEKVDTTHVHGAVWALALPTTRRTHYAAFRIASTQDRGENKNGLRIAMTPLTVGAP